MIQYWKFLNRKGVCMNLEKLEKDLMIKLTEHERDVIGKKSETFLNQIALLDAIDTDGVIPMTYPLENTRDYLREDVINHTITQAEAFKNAPKTQEDYIEIVQVIDK